MAFTQTDFNKKVHNLNENIEVTGTYINVNTKVNIKCKICGKERKVSPKVFYRNPVCTNCNLNLLKKEKERKLIEFLKNKNVTVVGEYVSAHSKIEVVFNDCGHHCFIRPNNLLNGCGCNVCKSFVVLENYNDLETTRPDLVKYLVNKNDAKKHTRSSNIKVMCSCPDCKTTKMVSLNDLDRRGYSCLACSDGVSYPNKFGRAFLRQLPIKNIIMEYQPQWAKPYRYDNYFEYKNKAYILEMDGYFHKNNNSLSGVTAEQSIKTDKIKDLMAEHNGILVIRIDCCCSSKDYIRESILNSELSKIFDLSQIDWDFCDVFANKNLLVEVCKLYNLSKDKRCKTIAEKTNSTIPTVYRYLIKGTELGLCKYKNLSKISVEVYSRDSKQLLHKFDSYMECERKMKEIYGVEYNAASIRYATLNNHYYKNFSFWRK